MLKDLPKNTDEVPEEQKEETSIQEHEDMSLEIEKDQYVEDPYDNDMGEHTEEFSTEVEGTQDDQYLMGLNMMSFINEPNEVNGHSHLQIASAKKMSEVPSEETIINELVNKPTEYTNIRKTHKIDKISKDSIPRKILKRTPPIMDSKL